jgi:hypothetical protein
MTDFVFSITADSNGRYNVHVQNEDGTVYSSGPYLTIGAAYAFVDEMKAERAEFFHRRSQAAWFLTWALRLAVVAVAVTAYIFWSAWQ